MKHALEKSAFELRSRLRSPITAGLRLWGATAPRLISLSAALGITLLASSTATAATSVEQVQASGAFPQPLEWVGGVEPGEAESGALLDVLHTLQSGDQKAGFAGLESFLQGYPQSPWAPSVHVSLAEYYRRFGRYTPALEHWEAAWNATKASKVPGTQKLAARGFAGWTRLLASLGQKDKLMALYKELHALQLPLGSYSTTIENTGEGLMVMRSLPGLSYRCGSYALANVAQSLHLDASKGRFMREVDSPEGGFHVSELLQMAQTNGLTIEAVHRPAGAEIPVPSVVHWRLNHYAAIVERKDNRYKVIDPTFEGHVWMDVETIDSEASGVFLVPQGKAPATWGRLSDAEKASVYGKGEPLYIDDCTDDPPPGDCDGGDDGGDDNCDPPTPNDGGSDGSDTNAPPPCCTGMPVWSVSEPYTTLWLRDVPLLYRLSNGKWMKLQLTYKHRGEDKGSTVGNFGDKWECNWLGLLKVDSATPDVFVNHQAGGGNHAFQSNGTLEYKSARSLNPNAPRIGIGSGNVPAIISPTGARNHYERYVVAGGITNFFLTHRVDRYGRYVRFDQETAGSVTRLKYVVDVDGRTNTVYYQNSSFPNLVTAITNVYGQGVIFAYDTSRATPVLTNIVDAAGMATSFKYDNNDTITNMVTPYGMTSFQVLTNPSDGGFPTRGLLVTEPSGDNQLYEYYDFHHHPPGEYQSFHWNRAQYAAISADGKANPFSMPNDDYLKASGKNWLTRQTGPSGANAVSDTLTISAEAANDYGYRTTQYYYYMDTLKRLTRHDTALGEAVEIQRNTLGRPTITTYYHSDYNNASYTNTFDASGINLQTVRGPRGELVRGYGYDSVRTNLLTSVTNALGYVIRYTHESNTLKVITITLPSGLVRSNVYYSSGAQKGFKLAEAEVNIRTNYFGYLNGNLVALTNELGLVTSYQYDSLNRLVSTAFPDGTTISNVYDKLDIVAVKDRANQWTRFVYNNLRQLIAVTNVDGQVTQYNYCNCGSPHQITRWDGAKSLVTTYEYDMAGRKTSVTYPDGYELSYGYDGDDNVSDVTDSGGYHVGLSYVQMGETMHLSQAQVGYLPLFSKTFDEYGRVISEQNRNGVVTTNAYDFLGRVIARREVGAYGSTMTGLEEFVYDSSGLTNYVDQRGGLTTYSHDITGRLLAETNANHEGLQYTYNAADELLTLTDGNGSTTRWSYDLFGRVTNKVDAANNVFFVDTYDPLDRLTNRWSAAKGDTIYRYDALGNLTNVVYTMATVIPASTNIAMRYDGFNRLISIADAIGTTTFTWTDGDRLAAEDGPWAMDSVSYVYTNRLRAVMSLLAPNASAWTQSYGYDEWKRLLTLFSPAGEFDYQNDSAHASAMPYTVTVNGTGISTYNVYDDLARLTDTSFNSSRGKMDEQQYTYDGASQRTQQGFMADEYGQYHYVNYAYDNIGQLKTAQGRDYEYDFTTGTHTDRPRLQEQFGYAHDKGWNLQFRTNGGFVQTFNVNSVNELVNVTNQGTFTVAGLATERKAGTYGSPAGVTNVVVSGTGLASGSADLYTDGAWARPGAVLANGNNSYTAVGSDTFGRTDTATVSSYVVSSNSFAYDLNGNLRTNNTRVFDYDGENQLICITEPGQWKSEFYYDGMMRRRIRKEYTYVSASSSYVLTNEVHYVYDGRLVVQERDGNNLPQVTYTRGDDLSGSLRGADGIGGLLARTANPQLLRSSPEANAYYHSDANGNITVMLNTSGQISAKYSYDPYGNILAMQGPLSAANAYRFSSREYDCNSGLYCYGYRFYSPSLQRWINRDPLEEFGGLNLYGFVGNRPTTRFDLLGLCGSVDGSLTPEGAEIIAEDLLDMAPEEVQAAEERAAAEEALKMSDDAARSALRNEMKTAIGQDAHHEIPLELKNHPLVKKAAEGGFNINKANNGVNLDSELHSGWRNWNEWHKDYNDLAKRALDQALKKYGPNMTREEAAQAAQKIADWLGRQAKVMCHELQ